VQLKPSEDNLSAREGGNLWYRDFHHRNEQVSSTLRKPPSSLTDPQSVELGFWFESTRELRVENTWLMVL